jgi:Tol biopolymer transport system component
MTVVAPPPRTPPRPTPPEADPLEALIKEARRRARRRRIAYGGAAVAVIALALAFVGFVDRHRGPAKQVGNNALPSAPTSPADKRTNGLLVVLDDTNALAVVNPDGSRQRRLTTCPGVVGDCDFRWYAWSPDGRRLAFLAGHSGGALTASNLFLYVINPDGTGRRRLAHYGSGDAWQSISWSPDSRRIVFAANDGLFVVTVATGEQRRLGMIGTSPAWSPDGSRIAFGLPNALYTIKPDGSGLTQLAAAPRVGDPEWSPDATRIAFDTADKIDVIDADGSHLKVLAYGAWASGPGTPSWSPDGKHILFFSTPNVGIGFVAEVWVMRSDGSGRRRLYRGGCCVGVWSPPIWSPDGTQVAFTDSGTEIHLADTKGLHRHELAGYAEAIAWQPITRTR